MIIVTRYNEQYAPYKPFWEYCIEQAYPNYAHHAMLSEHPAIDRLLIDPYPSHIDDNMHTVFHQYHYITDIDMMILPENPGIKEFHLAEMKEDGLCYSNSTRSAKEERGLERVTGLHFVGLEWFEKTEKERHEYQSIANDGLFKNRIDDELILKQVIERSGLKLPKKKSLMKRHHGIHFGTLRAYKRHDRKLRFEQLRLRISPEQARQWQKVSHTEHFQRLIQKAPEWLQDEMQEMDVFTRTRAKQT